jgi:hypothetical protein
VVRLSALRTGRVHVPQYISWRFVIILSSHLRHFRSGVPFKTLYDFIFSLICVTYSAHFIPLSLIILTIFDMRYKSWNS